MENSYGIFLVKNKKILIGHPTRAPFTAWTIPKGRAEEGETPVEAALREFKEEAGIDLSAFKEQLTFIGTEVYRSKKKQIHGFFLTVEIDLPEPQCTSLVVDKGEPFYPEIDSFKWVSFDEALTHVFDSQKELLRKNKEKFVSE